MKTEESNNLHSINFSISEAVSKHTTIVAKYNIHHKFLVNGTGNNYQNL